MAPKGSNKPSKDKTQAPNDKSRPSHPSVSSADGTEKRNGSNGNAVTEESTTGGAPPVGASAKSNQSAPPAPNTTTSSGLKEPAVDPLQSLQSLWTNLPWGTSASATSASDPRTATTTGKNNAEWLSGAQNMWNEAFEGANAAVAGAMSNANAAVAGAVENANAAMASAGEAVQKIDASVLEGGLANLRDASDKLVRDVKEGVAALSEDAKKVSAEASSIGNNTNNNANGININGSALLENLKSSTREALEIFTDKEEPKTSSKDIPAPWDPEILPPKERKYAGKLRERMLKLVVDAIYSRTKRESLFLSGIDIGDFNFDLDINLPNALAVLEVDPNVKRLRAGLVPGKMKEHEFWNIYFWHVRHTRRLLIANNGTLPTDELNNEEEELFRDNDKSDKSETVGSTNEKKHDDQNGKVKEGEKQLKEEKGTASSTNITEDGVKDWDKEIDDIFDS